LESTRCGRGLIVESCEEMMGEVCLRCCGSTARDHMPGNGDRRKQESEKAKDRDGKEDMHASVRRITRGTGSCTPSSMRDGLARYASESLIQS